MLNSLNEEVKDFISQNNVFEEVGENFSTFHPKLHTWGIPNFVANTKKYKTTSLRYAHQLVFECTYHFDKLGRRISHHNQQAEKVGVFFGDSITFGTGVSDLETLPSFYSLQNKEISCFNYGFPGHGPGHMLIHIQSDEFRENFKDKEGKVFYILRDDAIKVTNGKVNWCKGFPKIENGEYIGEFTNETLSADSEYLASEFSDQDFLNTVSIFTSVIEQLKTISNKLEFEIVILPSTFCNFELIPYLKSNNIKYKNLYFTDIEFLTDNDSRFLDGTFKPKSLDLISKILSNKNNIQYDLEVPSTYTLEQVVELLGIMMPSFVDYPDDDSGVLCSLICKWYGKSSYINLHKKFKKVFESKTNIVNYSTDTELLKNLIKEEYIVKPSIYKSQ